MSSKSIIVKQNPDCIFKLCRTKGISNYFYILGGDNMGSLVPMLHIPNGLKFFSAQALAIRIYDVYVSSMKEFNFGCSHE
jgi:hypothetical protein